ncbi:ricin-type beta-trefoil lectin domain protein [Dactylosporangium sp. CA-152071]|uniref:ricin-type beta-trefoil lectin domain protein n=1 Tax=Dactylosporangium sp. CA-152071 TaxID=3239933 RepID=UPI003D8BEB45
MRRFLSGALPISLALTVAAVAGDPAAADPAPGQPGQPGQVAPPVDQRAAETAALQQAVESGRTVEVANSRSEMARTMATPRGTLVRESYAVPQWTKKDGAWRQIDLSLRKDGTTLAPAASVADVRFSAGGTGPLVTLAGAGGALNLTWPSKLPAPRIEGDTAVYESVLPDVDLQVQSTVEGFGYSLIVKTRQAAANPALAKLKFGLSSTGWSLKQRPGGGYETRDTTGKVTASAGPALMWDSAGVPNAQRSLAAARSAGKNSLLRHVPDDSRKADLPTTVEDGSLVIVPDAAMLADPNVAYPVVIDPWTGVGRARWGYTDSTNANRDDGIVRVGLNTDGSGTFRSFFAFDLTWLPGKQIRNAKFVTYMTHSWSCTATPVNLYRTGDLTGSGRQAWSGPGLDLHIEQKSGNAHKPSTGAGCANDPQPNMYMEFSNQTLVNDIVGFGQGRGSYTLGLSARDSNGANETVGNRWKKFDQASTALSVEYNSLPNTPQAAQMATHTDYTAAGQACVTGATRPIVRSMTPWLKATVSDPDGDQSGQLSAAFSLERLNGSTWAGVAGWPKGDSGIPSGTLGEVQVPAGTLTSATYRWQVRVSDTLGGTSNYSAWCEFSVDTTPPGVVPTVTAADGLYLESPPNDTMRGSVGRSGQFTFGANGETDIVDYEYQLDGSAKTYVAASVTGGPATVWVTPTHRGEHVLTVRSRDAAQNASPPRDYRFLVNTASDPKAVWKLDEGTGVTLNTTPAGGPAATVTGGQTWVAGRVLGAHPVAGTDGALRFDGVDDLAATAGPVLDTSKSFSAAAWVRLTATDSQRTVMCQEGAMACGFAVHYRPAPDNRWSLSLYGSDTTDPPIVRANSAAPPVANRWTHLAVSWDAGTKTAKLFVNGDLSGTVSRPTNWNATGALLIGQGKFNGSRNNKFAGDIGDVRVWDRAIDPSLDLKPLVAPVPTGAWAMEDYDEDVPRQVTDDSGYQHPLTLTDAPGATWCEGNDLSGGLCLDGVTGAAATAGPVVHTDQSYSVSGWVRITDTSVSRSVFAQQGTRGAAFTVRYDKVANRWAYAVTGTDVDAPTVVKVTSLAAPVLNSWTFLEAVYDAQAGRIRLFVDDKLQAEATIAGAWDAAGPFTVGRTLQAGAAAEFFAGTIDGMQVSAGATRPVTGAPPAGGLTLLRSGLPGKCLDNYTGGSADGNNVTSWSCNGGYNSQLWTLAGDNTIRIVGKCLDVVGSGTAPATRVQLYTCNNTVAQQWQLGPDNSIRNPNSGLCLDVMNASTADGAGIQIWTCDGNSAQQWTMQWAGIGMVHSGIPGKCIDNNLGLLTNGNPIQSWDCNGGANSQIVTVLGDGTIRVAGKCLDVVGYGTTNGSKIHLFDCNLTPNQLWELSPNNSIRNPVSGRCLDVPNSSTVNGTQLQIYDCNATKAQEWLVS